VSRTESSVFVALQANADTRELVEAILADNPHAVLHEDPAMVRISAVGSLSVHAESVSERIGRDYDLQEMHINLISLSGHVDETDETFTLSWAN